MFRTRLLTAVILGLTLSGVALAQPLVTLYPAPGDLSTVEHLCESADYTVMVNGRRLRE